MNCFPMKIIKDEYRATRTYCADDHLDLQCLSSAVNDYSPDYALYLMVIAYFNICTYLKKMIASYEEII